MAEPAVTYEVVDGIAVATLAAPASRNALSPDLLDDLARATARAGLEGAQALVLTGEGRTFCSGGDLSGLAGALAGDEHEAEAEVRTQVDRLHRVISGLRDLPLPTVAAINGPAIGAGVALALACDVRVIARSAFFMTGYVAVGATPDGGASFHLARAMGAPNALAAFLLNRRLGAEDLLRRGLVDEVAEDGEVAAAGGSLARGLSQLSFPAIQAMRDLVYSASGNTLGEHLEAEKRHFVAISRTDAFREAMAPFARQPAAAQL